MKPLAVALMIIAASTALGADYKSAHKVAPGDIISADMINELFDEVEDFRKTVTEEDLVGTWRGEAFAPLKGVGQWSPGPGPVTNYYCLTNVTLEIYSTGTVYWLKTSAPDPFQPEYSSGHDHSFSIKGGLLLSSRSPFPRIIDRISATRIRILCTSGATPGAFMNPGPSYLILLDKDGAPPDKPHLDRAEAEGQGVVLEWLDQSDDETGFGILRRDKLSGVYSNVAGVGLGVTCVTNSVPASGFYWYRITATNENGASIGSNVKRVTVP